MAKTYTIVVTQNQYTPGSADPAVFITGTVNGGNPVTITVWLSAYSAAQAQGLAALEALVAPLLIAADAAQNPPPPQPPVNQVTGTFTFTQ